MEKLTSIDSTQEIRFIDQIKELSNLQITVLFYLSVQSFSQYFHEIERGDWVGNRQNLLSTLNALRKRKLIRTSISNRSYVPIELKKKVKRMKDIGINYFKLNTIQSEILLIIPEHKFDQKTITELSLIHSSIKVNPCTIGYLKRRKLIDVQTGYHLTEVGLNVKNLINSTWTNSST